MNTIRKLTLAALAGTAFVGSVPAQGLTRDQVRAELAEARRNGTLSAGGEANLQLRDLHPGLYPAAPRQPSTRSRAAVQAELREARERGELIVGEAGVPEYELTPHRFPARPVVAGKTRDEVRAELAEARRLGDIPLGEDGRTLAEVFPHVYAAARAQHAAELQARKARTEQERRSAQAPAEQKAH